MNSHSFCSNSIAVRTQHYNLSISSNNLQQSRKENFVFEKNWSKSPRLPTHFLHIYGTPRGTTSCRQRLPRPGVLVCFYFAESRKSLPSPPFFPLVLLEKFPRFRRQNRFPTLGRFSVLCLRSKNRSDQTGKSVLPRPLRFLHIVRQN